MSAPDILQRIETARNGSNPTVVCQVTSGWVVLADMQYLRGYCILLADPPVESLNDLDRTQRVQFLTDMSIIGDALLEVTGACRINYAVLGNNDPLLHAHIIPRYMNEPDEIRRHLPWSYSKEHMAATPFNLERDRELIMDLAAVITKRSKCF